MKKGMKYFICSADLVWITAAFMFVNLLRYGRDVFFENLLPSTITYAPLIAVTLILWLMLFFSKKLEGFTLGWHLPRMISQLIVASGYFLGALLALGFVMELRFSRFAIVLFALLLPFGLILIRCAVWSFLKSKSLSGAIKRVVIIGDGRFAHELAHKIAHHPELLMEVVGFLSPKGTSSFQQSKSATASSSIRTLDAISMLQQRNVRELIITDQLSPNSEMVKLLATCQRSGVQIRFVPHWFDLNLSTAKLAEIDGVPLISLESRSLSIGALGLKRALELVLGTALLVLFFPLMCLISAVLRAKKGAAVKKELRCGLNGEQFWLYRFNIDRWSPNLVGFEKFLAQYSLTELPQIWNVIRGEMALVGPRPEPLERVKHYSLSQERRLSLKPGLTGLAQVTGLREHHSSAEKVQFDLQYIDNRSIFMDVSIILQTVWTLCHRLIEERVPHFSAISRTVTRPLS